MTPEPVLVLWSDPIADPILLRNIGSYPHYSKNTLLLPSALSLFRPWLLMQGCCYTASEFSAEDNI